jgi:FtsZ-binding cell division protein ZapB
VVEVGERREQRRSLYGLSWERCMHLYYEVVGLEEGGWQERIRSLYGLWDGRGSCVMKLWVSE